MSAPAVYDLTNTETRLNWEKLLLAEVCKRTAVMNPKRGFVGDEATNVIQRRKAVFAEGGSRATITLRRSIQDSPAFGNQSLRDREAGLRTATFAFDINQVRQAVAVNGRMSAQRVPWDLWKESLRALGEYFPIIMESAALMHLAGITTDISTANEWYFKGNHLGHTMSNVPRAPDANHIIRVHDGATDDVTGADTSAILDYDTWSRCVALAKVLPIPIRPAMVLGQELYIHFVHPYQVAHLKDNSRWLQAMRDTLKGGAINGNPLWTGALGIVDGVLVVETPYVPPGVDGSGVRVANARRSVFCGAQALTLGLAKEYENESTFTNDTESWDYGNNKGVAATIIAGMACPKFNVAEQAADHDYARLVVTSYVKELYTSA